MLFCNFDLLLALHRQRRSENVLKYCPCQRLRADDTVRDQQGLALSSRNQRIDKADFAAAISINRALFAGSKQKTKQAAIEAAKAELDPKCRLDYIELINPDTFEVVDSCEGARMVIAAWVGEVRLIDNLLLGGNS